MEDREILTKDHDYWRAFIFRLSAALLQPGKSGFVYKCNHDLKNTEKILISLYNIDVEGSLDHFRKNVGCCDCEVLMNCTNLPGFVAVLKSICSTF